MFLFLLYLFYFFVIFDLVDSLVTKFIGYYNPNLVKFKVYNLIFFQSLFNDSIFDRFN